MRHVDVSEPEECEQCGGEAFVPATRRERLARWFTHGAGASTAWYCRVCGASWSGGSGYAVLYHASEPRWRRRVRLPLVVLEAVRGARTWHPVPVFYAGVGAVALLPAAAVAVLTRGRWRVASLSIPVAAMVVAFLWSLASAAGRGRRDVLWRLAPDRAWQQEVEEELAGIREQISGFQLLVPEGWPGELSLDGASWSVPSRGPRVLQELTVIADQADPLLDPDRHAPGWRPPTPRVEIRCSNDALAFAEEVGLSALVDRAFPPPPQDLDDLEQADRREVERLLVAAHREREQQRQRREQELSDRWHEGSVMVDGAAVPARLLMHDEAHVGVATFDLHGQAVLVVAEGIDLDALRLIGLDDPILLVDELEVRRRRTYDHTTG